MSVSTHGAVRFSDAQLAAFEVLGIVPWVRRDERVGAGPGVGAAGVDAPASDALITQAGSAAPAAPAPSGSVPNEPVPHVFTPMPSGLPDLGEWLAAHPLAGFARRGEQRHETGPDASGVLVVCDAAARPPSRLPIEQREAALLETMMRAIDLAPGSWSLAVLADPSRDEALPGIEGTPVVGQRLDGRRALLWLVREQGETGASEAHRFAIDGVPAFRVPHPAVLLARPALKRQAWQVLKAVRNLLAGA